MEFLHNDRDIAGYRSPLVTSLRNTQCEITSRTRGFVHYDLSFRSGLLWVALLSSALLGCQQEPDSPPLQELSAPEADETVDLEIRSWKEVEEWVALQKGRVVVVDIWSTYCAPCIAEFPHFVELHNNLGGKVACASLSIDYFGGDETPEQIRPRVLEFLNKQDARTANFISSTPDEDILKTLEVVSIPIVLVFDKEGELHTTFNNDDGKWSEGGFSYKEHIVPLVDSLLK